MSIAAFVAVRSSSKALQGYQGTTLVSLVDDPMRAIIEDVLHIHVQQVDSFWESGTATGANEVICKVPVCSWLDGGGAANVLGKRMNFNFSSANPNITMMNSSSYRLNAKSLVDDGSAAYKEYVEKFLRNGTDCFGENEVEDSREHRVCVSVRAGPLSLATVGVVTFVPSLFMAMIFAMDKKMPATTWRTGCARLGILVLCTFASVTAVVGFARVCEGGYVFLAAQRIDSVIAFTFGIITTFFLALFDVMVFNADPDIIARRAARVRAAKDAGKEPKPVPSVLLIALKKAAAAGICALMFGLYATAVPMAFEAATSEAEAVVVYVTALVVVKTGGESLLKQLYERVRVPFYAVVLSLFAYELVTSTQAKILLASYPRTDTVLAISVASGFWELGVRLLMLAKIRADGRGFEELGWDKQRKRLYLRMQRIFAVVSFGSESLRTETSSLKAAPTYWSALTSFVPRPSLCSHL